MKTEVNMVAKMTNSGINEDDILKHFNTLKGFENGFPLAWSNEKCEEMCPGITAAQARIRCFMSGSYPIRATVEFDKEGKIKDIEFDINAEPYDAILIEKEIDTLLKDLPEDF